MARIIHTDTDHHEALTELDRLMEIDPEWELDEESERFLEAIFAESDFASSGASAGPRKTVG